MPMFSTEAAARGSWSCVVGSEDKPSVVADLAMKRAAAFRYKYWASKQLMHFLPQYVAWHKKIVVVSARLEIAQRS